MIYRFKQPFRDGTTHVVLEPLDFMPRLAALVPRPRLNLTRFQSVFAPNCKHREPIVPRREPEPPKLGKLRVIASIEDPDLIVKILEHVRAREPAELPQPRAPPPPIEHPDTANQDTLF